jgi:aryl-alcohol dehydrogenase-like predicted oxidoreductase
MRIPYSVICPLALGTVQFGLRYGVSNQTGRVPQSEVARILAEAVQAGIEILDTAVAYGESEATLGQVGIAGWRVITKLPPLPSDVDDVNSWVQQQLEASLRRLGVSQVEAVLLHRSSDLLGERGPSYLQALSKLKPEKARHLGVSIYDPAELDALWPRWVPDMVQAPCNALDRRLLHSGWLERLERRGVRVHVRSAFLQGLLLMSSISRPAFFASWMPLLDRWLSWCREAGVAPLEGALGFVRGQPGIECVVVGVDSAAHLREIVAASQRRIPQPPLDLWSNDLSLIDPSRWKL